MFIEDESVPRYLTLVRWVVKILVSTTVKGYTLKTAELGSLALEGT